MNQSDILKQVEDNRMYLLRHFVPMFFCCLVTFACSSVPQTLTTPADAVATSPYLIGPQDVIEIAVWQNSDISRTVTVRPDGKISLPLIHDVQAAGMTPDELREAITVKLRPFVDTPEVSVIVQQINSRRFYIQGEVKGPGTYPLLSTTTLSQAIVLAGGLTDFAKKNRVQIIRKARGYPEMMEINYADIMSGKSMDSDIALMPGDTIVVP